MKISSVIREKAGLKPLARNKIVICEGNSPPVLKGQPFGWKEGKYIPSKAYIEVGQDWILSLDFSIEVKIDLKEK